jgi:Trypsin-like peptidase domain
MLSVSEIMTHSTARIECTYPDGSSSSGSGFYYNFFRTEHGSLPALVTNRHVVEGSKDSWFHITMAKGNYEPDYGKHQRVKCQDWIYHPDASVDLAVSLVGSTFKLLEAEGKKAFYSSVHKSAVADHKYTQGLTAFEDIVVIGYPNGIWDHVNNLPILRRGMTATPLFIDYHGKKEFLIDCSIFPGSSGSPVYLFNQGSYASQDGSLHVGSRTSLLGIVYAVYEHTISGEMVIKHIPTTTLPVPVSKAPNNIGLCIKSSRLLEFEKILESELR